MSEDLVKALLLFLGGSGVTAAVHWYGRRSEVAYQDRIVQRGEWRDEVGRLQTRLDALSKQVDAWQERYYGAEARAVALQAEHSLCLARMDELTKRVADLEKRS